LKGHIEFITYNQSELSR